MQVFGAERFNFGVALVLLVLCLGLFTPTLNYPFMMDDKALIARNDALFDAGFLQVDFLRSGPAREQGGQYVYFRPVTQFLNAMPAYFFGKDPYVYRVINLLLFYLACVSVFELLNAVFRNTLLAGLSAVFFCVHPVNGVLVNYITATGYSVLIITINCALMAFLQGQETNRKRYYAASAALFLVALMCHETAVAFPLYLGAVLWCAQRRPLKTVFLACLPFAGIIIVYILFRQFYAAYSLDLSERLEFMGLTWPGFLAAFFQCAWWYVKALVVQDDIVLMWAAPQGSAYLTLWNILGVCGFLIAAYLIFVLRRRNPEQSFGFSWLLIGLGMVLLACSSRPSLGVINEPHWLFFATIGFCVITMSVLLRVHTLIHRWAGRLGVLTVLLASVLSTLSYNALWADEIVYCRYMAGLSPDMRLVHFWLGDAYWQDNDLGRARYHFTRSLQGYQSDWEAYTNLGYIENTLGNNDTAERFYLMALRLDPGALEPKNNLAALYIEAGKYPQAEQLLFEIIEKDNYYTDARKNLAVMYLRQGMKDEAEKWIGSLRSMDPQDQDLPALLNQLN